MAADYELSADPDLANRDSMTIFINYRLFDFQKRFLGVTGVGITINTLNTLIQSIEQRFGQRVYFVNKTGNIVLANNSQLQLKGNIAKLEGMASIASQILGNTQTPQRTSYQKSSTVVQVNSRYIPELDWFVLIEQDEAGAFAPLLRSFLLNLAVGTLATALVLGLSFLTINQYQKRLEKLATVDTLTEAQTRSIGETLLEQALKESLRNGRPFSLVLFDFDNFKTINDTYGHAGGDTVLKDGIALAKSTVRAVDTVVRWGGEEFLVILKNASLEEASVVAEKIRLQIANHTFKLEAETLTVTLSLGVAQLENNESISKLLQRADTALYEAKNNGKNRVASSNPISVVQAGVVKI